MARRPNTPPPPPAVQKFRIRYAKRHRLRFSSHRDFQRALERALRRCDVPMAYSAGFTPHPKISFAGATPTGAASEAEYVEISVVERCDARALREQLQAALPPGLDVLDVVEARAPGSFADRLTGSIWEIVVPGVSVEDARAAVVSLLARESLTVERRTKSGTREQDIRPQIVALSVLDDEDPNSDLARVAREDARPCAILRLVVRHSTPTVRPDDVLTALRTLAGLVPAAAHQATRLAQGPLDSDAEVVADPLAADRELVGA